MASTYTLTLVCILLFTASPISPNNVCTFRIQDKLFSLSFFRKIEGLKHYHIDSVNDTNDQVIFDFCVPFVPDICPRDTPEAFAFLVINGTLASLEPALNITTNTSCIPYSSDSQSSLFVPYYHTTNSSSYLNLQLTLPATPTMPLMKTSFMITCGDTQSYSNITINSLTPEYLQIMGSSIYGCPLLEVSSLWRVLATNEWLFGIILFLLGTLLLCFGVLMTHLVIFIAGYFLSFAVIGGIFTAFLSPESSSIAVYFSLLLILFLSTIVAYALTRLVGLELFIIGAFLGLITGALVNTIFCGVFQLYSVWSLVAFQIVFTLGCGILAFRYSQEVIVLSTSLTGAYMIVRPISWIFGGFPNQFLLYQLAQDGSLQRLPWTFYLYLVLIIALTILGALYQLLKIKRRDSPHQVESNLVAEHMEEHIDKYKEAVDKLIAKFAPASQAEEDHYEPLQGSRLSGNKESGSNERKSGKNERRSGKNEKKQQGIQMGSFGRKSEGKLKEKDSQYF